MELRDELAEAFMMLMPEVAKSPEAMREASYLAADAITAAKDELREVAKKASDYKHALVVEAVRLGRRVRDEHLKTTGNFVHG